MVICYSRIGYYYIADVIYPIMFTKRQSQREQSEFERHFPFKND